MQRLPPRSAPSHAVALRPQSGLDDDLIFAGQRRELLVGFAARDTKEDTIDASADLPAIQPQTELVGDKLLHCGHGRLVGAQLHPQRRLGIALERSALVFAGAAHRVAEDTQLFAVRSSERDQQQAAAARHSSRQ